MPRGACGIEMRIQGDQQEAASVALARQLAAEEATLTLYPAPCTLTLYPAPSTLTLYPDPLTSTLHPAACTCSLRPSPMYV